MNQNERLCPHPSDGKAVEKEYDIIIIGGGIAGCSAALASARHGKKTLLIEKLIVLGGLATTGHITIYLPLDDGYGRQVIGGISEELLKLSTRYAYHGDDISTWKEDGRRYECKFNGPAYSLALEEILLSEGIDILFDSLFTGAKISDGICSGVYVENKSGRQFFGCKGVVDASGDADLFFRYGSSCIAEENSLAIWLYFTEGSNVGAIQKRGGKDAPGLELSAFGTIDTKAQKHIVTEPYFGDTGNGVNRFVIDSHKRILNVLKENPSASPASLPGMADIRKARRIEGAYELSDKDANKHFEDNIACTGDWRRPGPVYEIPYRTLFNGDLKNVLSAGRCISTSGEAWEIIRCIPQASATGQAAGTALVLALESSLAVQDLDVNRLRSELKADGVILDANKE